MRLSKGVDWYKSRRSNINLIGKNIIRQIPAFT